VPIGTIRPVSSASAMKRSGPTSPSSGCSQRTSASRPTIAPVSYLTRRSNGSITFVFEPCPLTKISLFQPWWISERQMS
jgi:hypothetical protein